MFLYQIDDTMYRLCFENVKNNKISAKMCCSFNLCHECTFPETTNYTSIG